jgi:hypothetical protein
VRRQVEVEYSDGRVVQEELRFVVVHSSQLAQQQTQTSAAAQVKEAEAVAAHVRQVQAQWFACRPDAEAAIAAYEGQGPGRRGRRPPPWRYHAVHYRMVVATRRTRRARRGRPAKMAPPPLESGYRVAVEVETLANPDEDNGWTVLATTVSGESCADVEILQAYQDQNTTVEPGFRWIKNPAAIAPVWLEEPERIAALAMLTVLGLLVYSVIQRQVRLYLRTHDQRLPAHVQGVLVNGDDFSLGSRPESDANVVSRTKMSLLRVMRTGVHDFFGRSYWIPGSYVTGSSMSAGSNALPRLRTL